MIFLLRIVAVLLAGYFLYMVFDWWRENYSPNMPCPQCEGEGTWDVTDDEEACILCKGSGKIERQV
jgi:hypothetical protein